MSDLTLTSALRERMERETLKYACGRAITCQGKDCERILDCRDAVLVEDGGKIGISCARCFDTCLAAFGGKLPDGVEITDGRKLWPKPEPRKPAPRKPRDPNKPRLKNLKPGLRVKAKVNGRVTTVRIRGVRESFFGGRKSRTILGTNERTGREVSFRSTRRILSFVKEMDNE